MKNTITATLMLLGAISTTSCSSKFETCTCVGSESRNGATKTVYIQDFKNPINPRDESNFKACKALEFGLTEYYENVDCTLDTP